MKPKVSICVPNLNTRPFLPERFETLFRQSFQDWELLVYDSFSNDGAWEYFQELAAREPRMRVWQGPKEGTPGSWNPCLRQACGEYVYIATSDDTMAPDCLEKMVEALEAHPECDLAHCTLRAIDEHGATRTDVQSWWAERSLFAQSSGELMNRKHVRRAPFDGLLHLLGETVYISITQLLIRRSLFDRIGFFEKRWGSVGDFHWDMRAGLVANTVHVPETWGGWRLHSSQATAGVRIGSEEHARKIGEMTEDALRNCEPFLPGEIRQGLKRSHSRDASEIRRFISDLQLRKTRWLRNQFVLEQLFQGSRVARGYAKAKVLRNAFWPNWAVEVVSNWMAGASLQPVLRPA